MTTLFLLAFWLAVPPADCSLDAAFSGPAPGESFALVASTGRTTLVSPVPSPLSDRARTTMGLDLLTGVLAHEVVVLDASFVGSESLRIGKFGLLIPGDTVLAVPWGLDSECAAIRFPTRDWIPADTEVVIRVDYVRGHDGRRVVDVVGPFNGYPHSTHVPTAVQPPAEATSWLSPRDFLLLLKSAPTPTSDESRSDQLARFERTYRSGPPALLERFPGPLMLEWARRWASGGNAIQPGSAVAR